METNNNTVQETCIALKADGTKCQKTKLVEGTHRCSAHHNAFQLRGPHGTAFHELNLVHKRQRKELEEIMGNHIDYRQQLEQLKIQQKNEEDELFNHQRDERRTVYNGRNPDEEFAQRRILRIERLRRDREEREQHQLRVMQEFNVWQNRLRNNVVQQTNTNITQQVVTNVNVPNQRQRKLKDFVKDSQNVHTKETVKMVDQAIKNLLEIKVEDKYKNFDRKSDLFPPIIGEMIIECNLSEDIANNMKTFYKKDFEIYNYGKDIYFKILNAVWTCVKTHDDKITICKDIIPKELKDSVGQCPAGNLTRLCNILNAYLYNVNFKEPVEELGEFISETMRKYTDERKILTKVQNKLIQLNFPKDKWIEWVQPFITSGKVEFSNTDSSGNTLVIV